MLERTAGCLESGSLRRLVPISRKSVKSRRSLHSSFWNNGAVDIELSPLWAALIRGPQQADECDDSKASNATGGFLLDFLYPTGTINILRQCSGWGLDRHEVRHTRAGLGKLGQRLYTSSAKDYFEGNAEVQVQQSVKAQAQVKALRGYMDRSEDGDYSDAWAQYLRLDEADQKRLRRETFRFFSNSERVIDAERSLEIFQQIGLDERDAEDCGWAIRSYLRLRNLTDALNLYKYAHDNFETFVGINSLVEYMINNDSWDQTFNLLEEVSSFGSHLARQRVIDDIHEAIRKLPTLPERTLGLVDFVDGRIRYSTTSEDCTRNLIARGTKIVAMALCHQNIDQATFTKLISTLRSWKSDTPQIYDDAIGQLLISKKTKFAVQVYRQNRGDINAKFTHTTLHLLLQIFCNFQSVLGMRQILEDFTKLWIKPTKLALQMCMAAFANMSDSQTVHSLFEVLRRPLGGNMLNPAPVTVVDLTPVLQVHARRGELEEVVKLFGRMQEDYGVVPNMYCWNILLTAQSKAHDFDGAFATFQSILDSKNLRPDQYTFAAIMRACVTIGDLELTIELYRLADSLKIRKSTYMVDCLVYGYIQNEDLAQAEKVCKEALKISLDGSRTQMWNGLLTAYALRRETANINRILDVMSEAKIELDASSYSILMMTLCIVKQPDRAYVILKRVMKNAGVRPTNFHYAIVMGGYIQNGEINKVFEVQNRMRRRGVPDSASTILQKMKATHIQDQTTHPYATPGEQLQRAYQIFQEVTSSMDPQDITATQQKLLHDLPPAVAYPTMFYSYILYVLAQDKQHETVEALYQKFKDMLPDSTPPVPILSAIMHSRSRVGDFKGVDDIWQLALSHARTIGKRSKAIVASLAPSELDSQETKVYPKYQLYLTTVLTQYMISLQSQGRINDLQAAVETLLEEGFLLDNRTWNYYIQILAQSHQYKQAFDLCEKVFMPRWHGWQRIRHRLPERNRLPIELRHLKKLSKYYYAKYHTVIYLTKAYLEVEEAAIGSKPMRDLQIYIESDCQRTVNVIRTMMRQGDDLERAVLG